MSIIETPNTAIIRTVATPLGRRQMFRAAGVTTLSAAAISILGGCKSMASTPTASENDVQILQVTEGADLPGPLYKVQWARRDAQQAKQEYRRQLRLLPQGGIHYFAGMNTLFRRFYRAVEGKEEMPIEMSEARRATAILDEIFQQCRERDPERKAVGRKA